MSSTRRSFFGQIAAAIAAAKTLVVATPTPAPAAPVPTPVVGWAPPPPVAPPLMARSCCSFFVSSFTMQNWRDPNPYPFGSPNVRFEDPADWARCEPAAPTLAERLTLTDTRALKVGE